MTGVRVLLVDDEEEFVAVLAKRMGARGFVVDTAENGEAALDSVRAGSFDVAVLDLAMPGLDGIATLKQLKELDADVQVILLTGHATVSKGVEAMKEGATDFLEKPADFHELVAKIEKAAAQKEELLEKRREEHLENLLHKKGW